MTVIRVEGLTKRFRGTAAVDDLSFAAGPGVITGFLGPNGAGKSTTLRMLLGLTEPTAGSATVAGLRYRDLPAPARQVGAVLETGSFHPGRTGRNHLRLVALAAGLPPARVDEVLELVGLTAAARRRVRTYSLGMRQRLALAAALLGDPEVLVLDEPTNGLDPEGIRWLRRLLRVRAEQGHTILVSSHLLAEVAQSVDRVVIINGGRLVAEGAVPDLVGAPGVRVRSPHTAHLLDLLRRDGVEAELLGDGALFATGTAPGTIGEIAARHGVVIDELVTARRSLEDVFLELTGGPAEDAALGVRA